MKNHPSRSLMFCGTCVFLFTLMGSISLFLNWTFSSLGWIWQEDLSWAKFIVMEIRFPRFLLSAISGAGYALCGLVLQTFLRNPLVDPSLLGIAPLASVGFLLSLVLGVSSLFGNLAFSFLFTLIAPIIFLLSKQNLKPERLVLMGVAVSTFSMAIVSLMVNFLYNDYPLAQMMFWMFGSFANRTLEQVLLVSLLTVPGFILLLGQTEAYDALSLGSCVAHSLGHPSVPIGRRMIIGVSLILSPLVSLTGMVGFIGLIVPHLVRLFIGEKPSHLILPTLLCGATLTLFADLCVRIILTTYELNVGIMTAILGAPLFIHLLWRQRA